MVLGSDTSKKQGDLDATLPLEVGGGELRSNTSDVRYHSPDNDLDYVELEDDEYTNISVLGTTTLEMSGGGDTTDSQRANRPSLAITNSAGQSETNQSHGYSSDGQRLTDRTTPVESSLQSGVTTSGKSGGDWSNMINERRQATSDSTIYCGKSPQRRLQEYINRTSTQQQNATTDGVDKSRPGRPATMSSVTLSFELMIS